jgi:hypothetical protein
MSTPTPLITPILTQSWLKAHERIVLTFLVLAFGIYGWNKWLDKSAADTASKAALAEQQAAQSKSVADAAMAQLVQQQASFNQQEQTRATEMAALVNAIATRDSASASRVAVVEQPKTPTQAVTDLQTTYTLPAPVSVTSDGADVPTSDLQLFTVTKIDADTCTQDIADVRTELSTTTSGLTQATALLTSQVGVIADLKTEATKTAAANVAEVKALKADARKSKWHWFIAGFLAGFTGRSAIQK